MSADAAVLALLTAEADPDGCVSTLTRSLIAERLGIADGTAGLALRRLEAAGELRRQPSAGRAPTVYCLTVQPGDSTRRQPGDNPAIQPGDPATQPGESTPPVSRAHPPETTSSIGASGNRSGRAPAQEPTRRPGDPATQPGDPATPIGQFAVRTALEAAAAAGRSIEPALRARIGHAAQALAKDESVERILAGAQRLGEGGFNDLYTAVRAVERNAPPIAARLEEPLPDDKIGRLIAFVRGTWPRAVIDRAMWESELNRMPEEFLIEAVRLIAREGGDWPPTWGKVWSVARPIAETTIRSRQLERARLAEKERIRVRLAEFGIEE